LNSSSVEFQLLPACLHWPLTDTDRERVRALLRGLPDCAAFLDLVQHHQVGPLVFRNLDDAARNEAPAELLSKLRARALAAGAKSFRRVMETVRLVAELQRGGIEVRVLKGVALSIHAYADATLQDSIDIDLLVPVEQVVEAESVLAGCGYRRIDPIARLTPRRMRWFMNHAHHLGFGHSQTHEKVELHWGLTPNRFKHQGMKVASIPTASLKIGSHRIPSLTAEDMFLHACVHGAEHYWNRLKWLAQIAAMLQAMTPSEFAAVAARATQFGVTAEMSAAIALAEHYQLAGERHIDVPAESIRAHDRIVKGSIASIEAGAGSSSHHALVEFRDEWRAGSSFSYRRNLIERTLIRDESWELIDLPDSMFFLYALLAPLALMKHRKRMRARRATSSATANSGNSKRDSRRHLSTIPLQEGHGDQRGT